MRRLLGPSLLAIAVSAALSVTACGSSATGPSATGSTSEVAGQKIAVVAATNVYGDIAQAVGGDTVEVSSIITKPEQDPHSYEANTQVALQLSKARLVVENGGGYDDFVDTVLQSGKNTPVVVNAVTVSGLRPNGEGELNEHVWYSFPSVQKVADQIARELGDIAPAQAGTFTANAAKFNGELDQLIATEQQLKKKYAGAGVAITEPVPLYLLESAGLVNKTPAEFSEAIEEGEDVSTAVLKETLDLYAGRQVEALVYNSQTSGTVTEQVLAAADQSGVAVVPVTETLPPGQTYLSWMRDNLTRLGQALGQS